MNAFGGSNLRSVILPGADARNCVRAISTTPSRPLLSVLDTKNVRRALPVGTAPDLGYFTHVTRDHPFKDAGLFYRFAEDARTGGVATDESGNRVSFRDERRRCRHQYSSRGGTALCVYVTDSVSPPDTTYVPANLST